MLQTKVIANAHSDALSLSKVDLHIKEGGAMLAYYPNPLEIKGPHGIPLIRHAQDTCSRLFTGVNS